MNNRYSVRIIAVYFGELPDYFKFWAHSAANNATIDFLLITDQNINLDYNNIKIIQSSLPEIKDLIKKNIGVDTKFERPYKLCDCKPMYGEIFKQYLVGYDYWGYCDIDLILGDIRKFLTDSILLRYEKILFHGHLSVYRNNEKVNNYFKMNYSGISYEKVLTSDESFAFDEFLGIYQIYNEHNIQVYDENIIADISPHFKRLKLSNRVNTALNKKNNINYKRQLFYWEKGATYRIGYKKGKFIKEEYLYIHYQKRNFKRLNFDKNYNYIVIGKNEINSFENLNIDNNFIDNFNKYRTYQEYFDYIKMNLNFLKIKILSKLKF